MGDSLGRQSQEQPPTNNQVAEQRWPPSLGHPHTIAARRRANGQTITERNANTTAILGINQFPDTLNYRLQTTDY